MDAVAPRQVSYDKPLPGPIQESAPVRRLGSVRRTSHLDATRGDGDSNGFMGVVAVAGAARDLLTTQDGEIVRGEASLAIALDQNGLISEVDGRPAETSLARLLGQRVGFGFRSSVKELLADLSGTLLGLLVDDLSGAPAPSGYGAIRDRVMLGLPEPVLAKGVTRGATQADVCAGWRTGGVPGTRREEGLPLPFERHPPVAPELSGADPIAWHDMQTLGVRQSRRIRRLDLWREADRLVVDAMFRDSSVDHDLTARVVHEYTLTAVIEPVTLRVLEIEALPRSLPFPTDCPFAADSAQLIVGQPAGALRETVRTLSAGPVSCTHLNDAMRCLADVASLAGYLPG